MVLRLAQRCVIRMRFVIRHAPVKEEPIGKDFDGAATQYVGQPLPIADGSASGGRCAVMFAIVPPFVDSDVSVDSIVTFGEAPQQKHVVFLHSFATQQAVRQ